MFFNKTFELADALFRPTSTAGIDAPIPEGGTLTSRCDSGALTVTFCQVDVRSIVRHGFELSFKPGASWVAVTLSKMLPAPACGEMLMHAPVSTERVTSFASIVAAGLLPEPITPSAGEDPPDVRLMLTLRTTSWPLNALTVGALVFEFAVIVESFSVTTPELGNWTSADTASRPTGLP